MAAIFLSEFMGTALLVILGCGVVANVLLPSTKGFDGGPLMINVGWGIGVFAGVYGAYKTGGHLNPAVTLGIVASGSPDLADGIPVTAANVAVYIVAQMVGGVVGGIVVWLTYRQHFDLDADPAIKLGVFSTGPQIRSTAWNLITEIVATFVLVFVVIMFGNNPVDLGPLAAALLVVGIGVSLGGPTGYAINPARDLGPRIAHAIVPIKGKGGGDWGYSWIPVVGPLVGGLLAGLVSTAF